MPSGELAWLSVAEAGSALRERDVSARELVEASLARIDATADVTKSWVTVTTDRALAQADRADQELQAGLDRGPFHGIGYAVKDVVAVAGVPMTVGSRLTEGFVPKESAHVVNRLDQAGGICLGKTVTHEFAFGATSPPSRNPWDAVSVTGGSSGGSAAAVAAGQAPAAIGTDNCCSVRNPAALNGVCGIRPTFGRVSTTGAVPASLGMDTVGPICRTVEDAATMLTVMAGFDAVDPRSSAAPIDPFEQGLCRSVEGLVAGVPRQHFFDHLETGVADAVDRAILQLEELGIRLEEVDMPHAHLAVPVFFTIDVAEEAALQHDWFYERGHELGDDVRQWIEMGRMVLATDYIRANQLRSRIVADWEASFTKVDFVVTPATTATAKQPVDHPVFIDVEYPDGHTEDIVFAYGRNLIPVSLAGLPALVLPCGFSDDDLPVGLQLVGPAFDEKTALRVGAAYQRVTDWHRERPSALAGS